MVDSASKFVAAISELFSESGLLLGLILLILSVRWFYVGRGLKEPKDKAFAIYREQLREARFVGTYHRLLERWFLNPLTRVIGDLDELQAGRQDGWIVRLFGIQPWTAGSYELLLRLAVIYPILAVLVVWLWGYDGRLGSLILLPAAEWGPRATVVIGIGVVGFAWIQALRNEGWRQLAWVAVAVAVAGAGAFAFVVAGTVAVAGAFAVVVAFFVVVAGAVAGAFAVFVAVEIAVVFAVLGAVVGAGAGAFAVLGAFAGPYFFANVRRPVRWRNTRVSTLRWFGFTLLMLGAMAAISWWLLPSVDGNELRFPVSLLIFLGLLPLLNTLWDWVSLGVSRGLLGAIRLRIHQGLTPLLWGLADFGLAFVFLAGLVAMVTAAVAGVNVLFLAGGGSGLPVDLSALFAGLRAEPEHPRFYWLYFMFLSTLIPTLAHLLIAGASVMQTLADWTPLKRWRVRASKEMAENSVERFNAQLYLTVVPMSGLVVPLGLLWGLHQALLAHGGWLGNHVIDWAEMVADAVMGLV